MDRYLELKNIIDEEELKIKEFVEKFQDLSISELRNEFLSSIKYSEAMEQKIGHMSREESGHAYSTNAYAELCARQTLLLYQYATLLVYNRNLENENKISKQKKRKKSSVKMLDRHMKK